MVFFSDAPYCKPEKVQVFGVARDETVRISCSVFSDPPTDTHFEWRFNATSVAMQRGSAIVDMPRDRFRSPPLNPTVSIVEYVPKTEMDYGSLLCWATNSVGRQREPCVFHLVPAGVPDQVDNCAILNQTSTSLKVHESRVPSAPKCQLIFLLTYICFSDFLCCWI